MFHRSKTGAVDVIRVEVSLNADTRKGLANSLQPALVSGRPRAVLDLNKVELIDSQGLEEILEQHEAFAQMGGNLKLADPTPLCRDILHVAGIADRVEVYENAKSAVSSFLRP